MKNRALKPKSGQINLLQTSFIVLVVVVVVVVGTVMFKGNNALTNALKSATNESEKTVGTARFETNQPPPCGGGIQDALGEFDTVSFDNAATSSGS